MKHTVLPNVKKPKIKFSLMVEGELDFNELTGDADHDSPLAHVDHLPKFEDAIFKLISDQTFKRYKNMFSEIKRMNITLDPEVQKVWTHYVENDCASAKAIKLEALKKLEAEAKKLRAELAQ